MLYKDICKIIGLYLYGVAFTFAVPLVMALYYQFIADPVAHPQPHSTLAFVESIVLTVLIGLIFSYFGRGSGGVLYRREGLALVVAIWFLTPILAGLPFYLSQTLKDPLQCYFEATSGLTTTGGTVMHAKEFDKDGKEIKIRYDVPGIVTTTYEYYGTIEPVRDPHTHKIMYEGIEAVSKAVLFWRSFLQFLGGGGIVVLVVAVLPVLGVGGKVLFQSEVAGPMKESLTPRIKETAMKLWKIFVWLNVAEVALLMLTNSKMGLFDAVTIAFATISTGGFSVHSMNIGYYNNALTEWVVIFFMICGSINFALYYHVGLGKFYRLYEPEFIIYMVILFISCALGGWYLVGSEKVLMNNEHVGVFSAEEALRYATFQLVSAQTTTGFATADYDYWPYFIQGLMIIVMFMGGMSGSTAGGIKIMRLYMLFRIAQDKVESIFRPETVRKFRVGEREVDSGSAILVLCYFLVVVALATLGTMLYVMDGIDLETAFSCTACMINCIGLGFRVAGPTESFAFLSDFGLAWSSFLMVLGRLEFFAVLAILVPAFWRRNS